MAWKPSLPHLGFWIVCTALISMGCQEQESIRHYLAPKESMPEAPSMRLLAVMVPHGKDVWFFKFLGSGKDVSKHEAEFDQFVRSVRFKEDEETPLVWDTPAGWRRLMGPRPRYATLRFGRKGEGVEITITKLGVEASDVRQNLDRWRDQLSLPPLDDDALGKLRDNITVDGAKGVRVDFVGILKEQAPPMMKGHPAQRRPKRDAVPFEYKTPNGWELRPPLDKQGIVIPLVFRIEANGAEAEMTALSLPGDGGGLKPNVNRWRMQVGLAPLEEAQLQREARIVKAGDEQAVYVDLAGPGGAGKRILGAVLPHGRETWFFTLKGPSELVGKEQSHFEAFLTSLRFDGKAGAAHE